jgi:hypothetical protein
MRVPTPSEGNDQEPTEAGPADDQIWVPVRPIAEALGLDWPSARLLPAQRDQQPRNEKPSSRVNGETPTNEQTTEDIQWTWLR